MLLHGQGEQGGDEDRLGHATVLVLGGLEGLPGRLAEAVEVEAVVPVGAADERQPVRAQAVERVLDGAHEMLVERRFAAGLVIEGHRLVEDGRVAGLVQVGRDAQDQPGGSSLKPLPTASLPRLVSGWY